MFSNLGEEAAAQGVSRALRFEERSRRSEFADSVRRGEELFDGFGGESFVFAESLNFDGGSDRCAKRENAKDVARAGHLLPALENDNRMHVLYGGGQAGGDCGGDAGFGR